MNARENPKTLKEALTMFQEMNVTAIKNKKNDYFKNYYADLTSVINAVNHGAEFGLSFTQSIDYNNVVTKKQKTKFTSNEEKIEDRGEDLTKDIFVKTTMRHNIDKKEFTCCVPVLVRGDDKDNPQKMGSAITYAKRYGLQSLYGLASDDDDGNLAS